MAKYKQLNLTEVVRRAQSGEDAGEELQTDLDLRAVAVTASTHTHTTIFN